MDRYSSWVVDGVINNNKLIDEVNKFLNIGFSLNRASREISRLAKKHNLCSITQNAIKCRYKYNSENKKRSLIYFIQQGTSGPIKIGFTTKTIKKRLNDLQVGNPERLTLLLVMNGTKEMERKYLAMFSDIKISGEWFYPHSKLTAFIKYNQKKIKDRRGNGKMA